jgi:hypothetical protein
MTQPVRYRLPLTIMEKTKQTPWPESASEQYRPSDRGLSAKLVLTFADRGCHVVSVTDPYGRILRSLDRSRHFFFQVAPQLYSRGWVDPLLLRTFGSAENRTRSSGSVAKNSWPLDNRGSHHSGEVILMTREEVMLSWPLNRIVWVRSRLQINMVYARRPDLHSSCHN